LNKKIANLIIVFIWAIFLFGIWVFMSLGQGTEGQWWSLLKINFEEYGPMAIEFSYLKIFIFSIIFVILAFFITKLPRKKNNV